MPQNPVRRPRWFAVVVVIAAAAIAIGASSHQNRAWAAPGTDEDRADEIAASRRSASADQAGGQADLPWQFQVVDQAGGATGPGVVVVSLAYVGRGPVVAVADIGDDERPRWVGPVSYTHLDVYKRQRHPWLLRHHRPWMAGEVHRAPNRGPARHTPDPEVVEGGRAGGRDADTE